jgi:hypothetical protein
MKKLTPTQQNVIDKLKDGWTLRYVAGSSPYCYMVKGKGHASGAACRINTVLAVEKAGAIKRVNVRPGGCEFELTEVAQ